MGGVARCCCRVWSVSIAGVALLTLCNVFLSLRLLHTTEPADCPLPPFPERLSPLPAAPSGPCPVPQNSSDELRLDLRVGRWDTRRLYRYMDMARVGTRFAELSSQFSVCLATQSSLERLFSLVQVAHQWAGPISASVFIASPDEMRIFRAYMRFLLRCYVPVKERVTFHVAVPREFPSSVVDEPRVNEEKLECSRPEASLRQLMRHRRPESVRWRLRLPYPQNHMRNLARRFCQTNHVFVTDVDVIPSSKQAERLDAFLRSHRCTELCAYVIPTYELDERVRFPQNKSELVRLAKKGLARPFHHKVFIYNQFATNFSRWQSEMEVAGETVHVSHNVTNFEFLYEPFYVAPDTVPPHDERFVGYGYTRNTQVYETFVAGYQFQVLSPIFTVHWGLQNKKSRPGWRERQNSLNRRHFEVFKREVFARYQRDPLRMLAPRKRVEPRGPR